MMLLINVILFYLSWFACILGAAHGDGVQGPLIACLCFLIHLLLKKVDWFFELKVGLIVMLIGSLFDSILPFSGILSFTTKEPSIIPIYPLWMMVLWLAFSSTLTGSLRWIQGKTGVAIIFGFLGGPMSFIAAEQLGALTISTANGRSFSLLIMGIIWGSILPVIICIPNKIRTNHSLR